MSRIGDALKRAGAPDIADGLLDMSLVAVPSAGPVPALTTEPELKAAVPRVAAPPQDESPPAEEPLGQAPAPALNDAVQPDSRLIANPDLPAIAVEQYRRLAATLHHVQEDRGVKRVLVSSAVANEGKTLTAANLALTLSHSYQKRVLLVDADLRRPSVTIAFGLPNGTGLSEALEFPEPQKLPVLRVSPLLSVLPAGRVTPDPMAGLTSPRMAAILDEAAEQFDWVIVDSPPVGLLSDARLLASMVDAALLVVGAGSTPCGAVQRAIDAIGRERVLGVVLNRADETLAAAGEYHYYYDHYGNDDHRNAARGFFGRLLNRT